jgi:hypothetical protein
MQALGFSTGEQQFPIGIIQSVRCSAAGRTLLNTAGIALFQRRSDAAEALVYSL